MDVGNTNTDSILIGRDTRGYFLAARGSIRANLCYPLREALLERLDAATDIPAVYVDLSECHYMDSTFIGLLVAMDKKLQKGSGGRLHLLKPAAECMGILEQIHLNNYLLIEEQEVKPPAAMTDLAPKAEKPGADFILKAHEALMETSEEARRKFALLKETLERKLKGSEKPPQGNPGG
jgi:anti-anti-sigma factor